MLLYFCLPQTPKYLYLNNRNAAKTEKSLEFYHGSRVEISDILDGFEKEDNLMSDQLGFIGKIDILKT